MSNIQSLLKMIQSDNPNKRYDACKELRVSPRPFPQEAIDALNSMTNDSNPDVADAAQRALALHTQISNESEQRQETTTITISPNTNKARDFAIGFLGWLIFWNVFLGPVVFSSFFIHLS